LYYNPMSTFNHFWVPTSLLQSQNATPTAYKKFEAGSVQKTTQSAGCGMDTSGVLFFGLLNQNAIACWNSDMPYVPANQAVLAKNDGEMQFLSTVVVRTKYTLNFLKDVLIRVIVEQSLPTVF
jgi:Major royal jelly protein